MAALWRRTLALCADGALLAALGALLGALFFEALAPLGDWGRWIGAAIVATYFGVMNSRISGGQTLGKRWLRIRVVGPNGQLLSIGRSLVRVAVPLLAFGWSPGPLSIHSPSGTPGILAFVSAWGLGGAFLYLVLFNARSRQTVHDLAAGTWVVRARPLDATALKPTARPHLIAAGAWCALVLVAAPFTSGVIENRETRQKLSAIEHSIERTLPVRRASVQEGRSIRVVRRKRAPRVRQLDVTAVLSARPESYDRVASETARVVLEGGYDFGRRASLNVTLAYGYDILIASGWERRSWSFPPSEWKRRFERPASDVRRGY